MSSIPQLFSPQELMRAEVSARNLTLQAAKAPFAFGYATLQVLAMLTVGYVEWEIFFRVFDYLAGDAAYWQPALMALTALIMVIAYHLILEERVALASRLIRRLVDFLVFVFPVGAGLLIAAILYRDGLAELARSEPTIILGQLPPPQESASSVLDWAYANISNPAGVVAFSIGVGGLSVVNLFVVHGLLSKARANIESAANLVRVAGGAQLDLQAMKSAQRDFASNAQDIADERLRGGHFQALAITSEVQEAIANGTSPHRRYAKQAEYSSENRFLPGNAVDPKQVNRDLARIDAITHEDIIKAIHIDPQED